MNDDLLREPTLDEQAGIDWWNAMPKEMRAFWFLRANTDIVAEAWAAYKQASIAVEDTLRNSMVEALCKTAGIPYDVSGGNVRHVFYDIHGGHRKTRQPGRDIGNVFIDKSLIDDFGGDERLRALAILKILAVELDCYEAGESLAHEGLVETLRNGKYAYLGTVH